MPEKIKWIAYLFTILFVPLCMPWPAAGSDMPLTLEQAFVLALEQNPDIRIARGEEQIARNRVNIGNAGLLPNVDLVGSVTYQDNETVSGASSSEALTTTAVKVQASYTFFDGFGNLYTFRKLKSSGQLGSLQARNTIEHTLVDVSSAYYRLAEAAEQLEVAREAFSISRERLKRARLRSEYGQANSLDVLSAEVDAQADSVAVLEAGLAYQNGRRALALLLDMPSATTFSIDPGMDVAATLSREAVLEGARSSFAEYRIAHEQLRQADLDLAIAASDFYPTLGMQVNYGYSQTDTGLMVDLDDPAEGFSAVVTMTMPLFNGFKTSIARQNAKISRQNSQVRLEQAELQLEKLVDDTWDAYQNSLAVLDFRQRNLETAELNFQRTREQYVLGQVTTTAFREAQLNLITARQEIASARYNARLLEIELQRIGGFLVTDAE